MNILTHMANDRETFYARLEPYVSKATKILDVASGDCSFGKYFKDNKVNEIEKNKIEGVERWQVEELIPFDSQAFDIIHCSHFVEHCTPDQLYDLLCEMDRVLKPGGIMCISAPLLTDGFYEDLSHIRPYYPGVFINYLTGHKQACHTKNIIGGYSQVLLQYRYSWSLQKTGFTLILKKADTRVKCVECNETASEGSMVHPYCAKHFHERFDGKIERYNKYLLEEHL